MGIAFFTFDGLVAPLRSLVQWLLRAPGVPTSRSQGKTPAALCPVSRNSSFRVLQTTHRPLRVVRVVEGPRAGAGAGRMFMSGRMADVCAELERLAALEAAAG